MMILLVLYGCAGSGSLHGAASFSFFLDTNDLILLFFSFLPIHFRVPGALSPNF